MKYLVIILTVLIVIAYILSQKNKSEVGEPLTERDLPQIQIKPVDPEPPVQPDRPQVVEPLWKKWPRVREVQSPALGVILGDIDSHMPAGHHYSDGNKMTWAHETTHGINANIRNSVPQTGRDRFNGLYLLRDRAIVLKEPDVTIQTVANMVPIPLRGPSYKLYLVDQSHSWGDRPLYLFDEWVAYTNGSECGKELNIFGWYYELLQAHNFNVYCMYVAKAVQNGHGNYTDGELRKFMMWNIERTFRIMRPSDREKVEYPTPSTVTEKDFICPHPTQPVGAETDIKAVEEYIQKVRTAPEAEKLRQFAKEYFGEEWCKRVYGF